MAGGGTGGHVLPGLAVARELRRRGHSAVFVGTVNGVETRLVPPAGFALRLLEVGALKQVTWARRLRTLWELPASFVQAAAILRQAEASAVFSMGGYSSGPVNLMAWAADIPLVVMEPNAIPGFAHRQIGPLVTRALLAFESAGRYFPPGRSEVTGIPIRQEFFDLPPKRHQPAFTVLITGGSQGSTRLNHAVIGSLSHFAGAGLLSAIIFLHQAGTKDYNPVLAGYREFGVQAEVTPFLDDMPSAFARADVIICRAGASAVAEVAAAGRAAILAPFPFAADQHQLRNAQAMAAAGAALVIEDHELTGQRLFAELRGLLESPSRLEAMEQAARRLARPGAAQRAADVIEEVARHVL